MAVAMLDSDGGEAGVRVDVGVVEGECAFVVDGGAVVLHEGFEVDFGTLQIEVGVVGE